MGGKQCFAVRSEVRLFIYLNETVHNNLICKLYVFIYCKCSSFLNYDIYLNKI